MKRTKRLSRRALMAALPWALLAGCSPAPQLGPVSGKVTLDGKPFPGGVITLVSGTGEATAASIDSDGSFTLAESLPTGKYGICVSPREINPAVPERYYDAATSDLVETVHEGENSITLRLQSTSALRQPARRRIPQEAL